MRRCVSHHSDPLLSLSEKYSEGTKNLWEAVKRVTRAMLGFKSFRAADNVVAGIDAHEL